MNFGSEGWCAVRSRYENNPPEIWQYTSGKKQKIGTLKDSARKLFAAIDARREIALERFIFALGIRHVGETTARLLARHFGSVEALESHMLKIMGGDETAREEVQAIDGVGRVLVDALVAFFSAAENRQVVQDLLIAGVRPQAPTAVVGDTQVSGQTIVFTGTLENMSRAEAKARAEALGAKVAGSVSAHTNILVAGAEAGSKLTKAQALGVEVWSEADWLAFAARHR